MKSPIFVLNLCIIKVFAFQIDLNLPNEEVFKQYQAFKGQSEAAQESFRKEIFMKSLETIKNHNARFDAGQETYRMGLNQFSDMTEAERKSVLGFKPPPETFRDEPQPRGPVTQFIQMITKPFEAIMGTFGICLKGLLGQNKDCVKEIVDHRTHQCSGKVLDQGQCGSCYAFATAQSLDFCTCVDCNGKTSRYSSEQNIVDCSKKDGGNQGCQGGLMTTSVDYIKENSGIETNETYPYEAKEGTCRYTENSKKISTGDTGPKYKVTGHTELGTDETKIMEALKTNKIVYCAIKAKDKTFQAYKSGIFSDPYTCRATYRDLDHAIVIVGYGADENCKPYWIVKNSWSEKWGENGYFRLERGCCCLGICLMCGYPNFECDAGIDPRQS